MATSLRAEMQDLLVETIEARRSAVITGPMGIGKTHLLGEVIAAMRADGWVCTELRANPAAATIPFGALANFAVGGEEGDRLGMLRSTVDALREIGEGRPHLITVDDAPLLDAQSVAVFHELSIVAEIPLLATARSSDTESSALSSLWGRIDAERIVIEPLADDVATRLVCDQLDVSPDSPVVTQIVRRAAGNPLFIGELVRAEIADSPGRLTPRLRDVVEARIDRLDEEAQKQLLLVAVADPLDIDLDIVDTVALDRLEAAGLVATVEDGDFVLARPAHPLYGEVVRNGLTALRRRETARLLTAAMRNRPTVRRGDALRLAGWLRACGDQPSAELAVPAALEAISLLDVELANELVTIATAVEPGYPALFAAGEIARLTGDDDRALEWFDRAFAAATADEEIRQVALAIGQLHGFFRNEPDAAVKVLGIAADRLSDPTQRLELETERAMFGSMLGRFEDVLVAATSVLDHPDCGPDARWTALTNISWAEAQLIDLRRVHEHLDAAQAMIPDVTPERAGEIDLARAVKVNVLMEQGDLTHAVDAAADDAGPGRIGTGDPAGLTGFSLSQVEWMRGNAEEARRLLDTSLEQLSAFDAFNAYPFVRGASAIVAVAAGDVERARRDVTASVERGGDTGMWDRLWIGRARAWIAMSDGDVEGAMSHLLAAADVGIDTSHRGWAVLALHDAVAWGGAAHVAGRFELLRASMHDAPLFEALADNAIALACGDADAAAAHVGRFLSVGSIWHAGVASAGLAQYLLGSDEAPTTVVCRHATAARLWMSMTAPQHDRIEDAALSTRRLDVVRCALRGLTSREIADELFLSVRTVDNHLGASYTSLGIGGRSELAGLFASRI